jgi:hypothetical protein
MLRKEQKLLGGLEGLCGLMDLEGDMTNCRRFLAPVFIAALWMVLPAGAAENPKTLAIGASAPDFDLPGTDGRNHKLGDFSHAEILTVVFTCNHCPTAQAYEKRIQELADASKNKGMALVAISPNDPKAVRLDELGYTDLSDSLLEMKIRAKERNFTFPTSTMARIRKCRMPTGP